MGCVVYVGYVLLWQIVYNILVQKYKISFL